MHIREYFHQIQNLFDQISKISIQEILFDECLEFIAYIKWQITFISGYRFFLSEYVDVEHSIDKIKYSYHFMQGDQIIFRYENASDPHIRYLKTYLNHKHISNDLIVESEIPDLELA